MAVNEYIYPNEPPRFNANDIEAFITWSTEMETSDVTIQNEESIFCEIHGKKLRVTKRKLSKSEVMDIISGIYKSDGAISKLNGGSDVDMPWEIKVSRDKTLRFRVNMTAIFTNGHKGYSITIRTIKNQAPDLESLNLPQEIIDNLSPKNGMVLLVGGTGTGKSTLLASVLGWRIKDPEAHLKVLTYEAPIEYVYDDYEKPSSIVSQSEIDAHLPSFKDGVRNALRRKPDIILVGEMRDKETIGEGITASMTGHLVYGTLHANSVVEVIRRMVNVFPVEEQNARGQDIIASVRLVVGQMLLPSTDGKRVAIREYLVFTDELKEELLQTSLDNITYICKKSISKYGRSFLDDAKDKYDMGIISEKIYKQIEKVSRLTNKDIENIINKESTLNEIENNKLMLESINSNTKAQIELSNSIKYFMNTIKELKNNTNDDEQIDKSNESDWEDL